MSQEFVVTDLDSKATSRYYLITITITISLIKIKIQQLCNINALKLLFAVTLVAYGLYLT